MVCDIKLLFCTACSEIHWSKIGPSFGIAFPFWKFQEETDKNFVPVLVAYFWYSVIFGVLAIVFSFFTEWITIGFGISTLINYAFSAYIAVVWGVWLTWLKNPLLTFIYFVLQVIQAVLALISIIQWLGWISFSWVYILYAVFLLPYVWIQVSLAFQSFKFWAFLGKSFEWKCDCDAGPGGSSGGAPAAAAAPAADDKATQEA